MRTLNAPPSSLRRIGWRGQPNGNEPQTHCNCTVHPAAMSARHGSGLTRGQSMIRKISVHTFFGSPTSKAVIAYRHGTRMANALTFLAPDIRSLAGPIDCRPVDHRQLTRIAIFGNGADRPVRRPVATESVIRPPTPFACAPHSDRRWLGKPINELDS